MGDGQVGSSPGQGSRSRTRRGRAGGAVVHGQNRHFRNTGSGDRAAGATFATGCKSGRRAEHVGWTTSQI